MLKKKIINSFFMGIFFFCLLFLVDFFFGIKCGLSSPPIESSPLTFIEAVHNIPYYLLFSFLFGFFIFYLTNDKSEKSDKDNKT